MSYIYIVYILAIKEFINNLDGIVRNDFEVFI